MEDCIFCKIVTGEMPSHKVYEDDNVLAFMNIFPTQPGHTLVIPKTHDPHVDNLEDGLYAEVMLTAKKIAGRQKQELGRERVCLAVAGFDVPHAHVHVYPADNIDEFHGDEEAAKKEPDHESLSKIAEKLHFE